MAGGPYKTYMRGSRNVTVEESFALGMRYTDTPMPEGQAKTLVNFDFKDSGAVLIPRPGYQRLYEQALGDYLVGYAVHHPGQGAVRNTVTGEDMSRRYILFDSPAGDSPYFDFADAIVLIEQEFNTDFQDTEHKRFVQVPVRLQSGLVGEPPVETFDRFRIKRIPRTRTQLLHNISLVDPAIFNGANYLPAYTMLNSVALLPVEYTPYATGVAVQGFAKLLLQTTDGTSFWAELEYVAPYVTSPTEAVNYGYNMLAEHPYAFADELSAVVPAGYIIMEGIVPYEDETCTRVKFDARVGEPVTFRLYAQYPDEVSTYKFRWVFRELGTDSATVYEDEAKTDRIFHYDAATGSAGVMLTVRPPYKQCSITVTAFATADLTEPLQVMTLGSYHLTADRPGTTNNIEVKNYPLYSATDLCTWKQHVVVWGVEGAANMLFVSDTNRPGYFPYPQNAHIFEEAVVACVPYLGDLLVFTESKLHRLKWAMDGLSYTADMIQDKLYMSPFDKETITVVQNMVFFKNGNYFYMVVPRTSSAQPGALQLAPISTPITNLLDNFQAEIGEIVDQLYNFSNGDVFPTLSAATYRGIELHDYYNYLDTSVVRNVYKFRLVDYDRTTRKAQRTILYFDVLLNYDTLARAWTLYVMQANGTRVTPYRQNVTDTTVYVQTVNVPKQVETFDDEGVSTGMVDGFGLACSFIKPNVLSPRDQFPLALDCVAITRLMKNHQCLDTGYREHDSQHKKRYREIQFKINNRGQYTLEFGTEFLIDDVLRKPLYGYATRHITDPESVDYGYIYVERIPQDLVVAGGAAILAHDEDDEPPHAHTVIPVEDREITLQSKCWTLNVSQLSKVSVSKVRFRVSGKGYAPRLVLVSYNDLPYELMNHNWVYRTMNAR